MNKLIFKPGFETIFALGLIVVLGLPPVLLAQNTKDLEIKIENGDTTINGKKLKDLSAKDRAFVMKDLKNININTIGRMGDLREDSSPQIIVYKRDDSTDNREVKVDVRDYQFKNNSGFDVNRNKLQAPIQRVGPKKNFQSYDYAIVDNEGISTRVRFTISATNNDDLRNPPYNQDPQFQINNLNIIPEFNSGTVLLTFNLPSKANAEVRFINSAGNFVWESRTNNGNFSKSFALGLNGVYYLEIKDGKSIVVKKIVKEG